MKLAVSSIAWPLAREEEAAALLRARGVAGVELAPTQRWPSPPEAPAAELDACRAAWEARGLPIVAAQAVLFGRPDLLVFGDDEARTRLVEYLGGVARACARLGARALVFGAPKNRRRGDLPAAEALDVAVDVFGRLARAAHAAGTAFVLEANPTEYGADFATRFDEALEVVARVDHPGLGLHLDSACMHLAGDDLVACARVALERGVLRHVHLSAPYLAPLTDPAAATVPLSAFVEALRRGGYTGWVSLEMRAPDPFDPAPLAASIDAAVAALSLGS